MTESGDCSPRPITEIKERGRTNWKSHTGLFKVILALAILLVLPPVRSTMTFHDLDPAILLEDLAPEEMELLFESSLEGLQSDIIEVYESYLNNYQKSADRIEALRRSRRDISEQEISPLPTFDPEFWHSWTGNIKFDSREVLRIENITGKIIPSSVEIEKTFQLNLWNLPAVYLTNDGLALIMKNGTLESLLVRNVHTKSLRGGTCPGSPLSNSCASCISGSCVCEIADSDFRNVCVPCHQRNQEVICSALSFHQLKTKVMTGFEYYLDNYDPIEGLQRVIIASTETKISFFKLDDEGLQPMFFENGMTTISLARPITHLGYAETFIDIHGSILKKRFLFAFEAGRQEHQLYTLDVVNRKLRSGSTRMWHATGSDMKVWNSGGRIMIGIQLGNDISIHKLEANRIHEYEVIPVQTIRPGGQVSSWKTFNMNFENYFLVVQPDVAKIYHQNGISYGLMQELHIPDGLSAFRDILHLTIPWRSDKSLLLTGDGSFLVAYVWNGIEQQLEKAFSTTLDTTVDAWSTAAIDINPADQSSHKVLVRGVDGLACLEITATLEKVPDPLNLQVQTLHKRIEAIEVEYQRQESILNEYQDRLNNSVEGKNTLVGPITIQKGISVNKILEAKTLTADELYLNTKVNHTHDHKVDYYDHVEALNTYEEKMKDMEIRLSTVLEKLDDAVLIGNTSRTIEGKKSLVNGSLKVDKLFATELSFNSSVDDTGKRTPISQMLQDIIRFNSTEPIRGTKTFSKPLTIDNLAVDIIDGTDTQNLITISENATIDGAILEYLEADTIEFFEDSTVGGVDVASIPSVDEDYFLGHCDFQDSLVVKEITVESKQVSDVDIDRLNNYTLKISGGAVNGPLNITGELKVRNLKANSINGVNTAKFMSETVFTDQPAIITGSLMVPELRIEGDLTINGQINEIKFPESYPIITNGTVYAGAMAFDHLMVDTVALNMKTTKVDGMILTDLVTSNSDQYIPGKKTFTGGITFLGDMDLHSNIDGINLKELIDKIRNPKFARDKEFQVIFEGNLTLPSLKYSGTLNSINLSDIAEDILYDDEYPIVVESTKTFRSGLNVTSAAFESTFHNLNTSKLMTTDREHVITGEKYFENDLSLNSIHVSGLVDSIDLQQLEKDVMNPNQPGEVVTGHKVFSGTVTIDELEVIGKVNEINFTNILTLDGDQTFTKPQTIMNGQFTKLSVDSIQMNNPIMLNGVNLSQILEKRVSLNSTLKHDGTVTMTGLVTVQGTLYVNTVGDLELETLLENLVTTDTPIRIKSPVVFHNLSVYGPIITKDDQNANGLSLKAIDENAVNLHTDLVCPGAASWEHVILNGGVVGSGFFHGHNLEELKEDVVYANVPNQLVGGKKTFVRGFQVRGDINASNINGIDLGNRLLSRSTEQVITAPYAFSTIAADKNMTILGKFNEIDIGFLSSDNLKEGERILKGNVTFHESIDVEHLNLRGFLNDLNVADHLEDAVRLDENNVVISGQKIFKTDLKALDIKVNRLGGTPFQDFVNHVVLTGPTANITGTVTVEGTVSAPEVLAHELVVQDSIDKVDVNVIENEVIFLDDDRKINATLIINGDVHVEGEIDTTHLNGQNLESDFLTVDSEQTVPSNVTFGNVWTSDVAVGGSVNGWNLTFEAEDTLMVVGDHTITGLKTFTGSVKVHGNVELTGKVGEDFKVKLATQAVKLDEEAQIDGMLIFNETLNVNKLSGWTDMINGVNYTDLVENAWLINKPANITGRMAFESRVDFLGRLVSNSDTEKVSAGDVHNEYTSLHKSISSSIFEMNKNYSALCQSVVALNTKLESAIYEGDYFDIAFKKSFQRQRHSSLAFQYGNASFIVVNWEDAPCDSTLYRFDPDKQKIEEAFILKDSGYVHQWLLLENAGIKYLATAVSSSDNYCVRNTCTIWNFSENNSLIVHQELVPGERISVKYLRSSVKFFIYESNSFTTFKLDPTTHLFDVHSEDHQIIDISLSMTREDGTNVMFRSHKGEGRVLINGKGGSLQRLAQDINDAVIFEQRGKVFVVLSAVNLEKSKITHSIELYQVGISSKSCVWLDWKETDTSGSLLSFFAGNDASGTTFIVISQKNRFPKIYTLLGERLKFFAEIDIPRVEWMQYVSHPGRRQSVFPNHYIIFGLRGGTWSFTKLAMKGSSTYRNQTLAVDCNAQFHTNNEL